MTRAAADLLPLVVLARCVTRRRRARIVYQGAGGEQTRREIELLGLTFQDERWYAFAFCRLRRAVRLFRLDRVLDARATRIPARAAAPPGFDPAFFGSVEYLEPGAPVAHLASIRLARPLAAVATALLPTALVEPAGDAVLCHVRASRPHALAALVRSLGGAARPWP